MDFIDEVADNIKEGLFHLAKRDRNQQQTSYGKKAQSKSFFRDRKNEGKNEILYTDQVPVMLPDNKKAKYDSLCIQKFKDSTQSFISHGFQAHKTTHIKIQSRFLCAELRPIFRDYDVDFNDEDGILTFEPFEPLYFKRYDIWRRARQLEESVEDDAAGAEAQEHLEFIIKDVLNDDMYDLIKDADELHEQGQITWNLLWTLFPHHSLVIANNAWGYQQAYQVLGFKYIKDETMSPLFFDITYQYIHFDAFRYRFVKANLTIPHFTGKRRINELDVYPTDRVPNPTKLRSELTARGRLMLDYQDVHHIQILPALLDSSRENYDEILKDLGRADAISTQPSQDSRRPASGSAVDSRRRPSKETQAMNRILVEMEDDNLLLTCPLLHAFSLRSKKWIAFYDNAYAHLVADDNRKSLLLSLVKSQLIVSEVPEDPIPEKGFI
ncbi:hypothetical protein B0T26DRAFT_680778 [Lasiosphaeria miniovina]|uniref:DUF7025 domain-containing protein n=1 Tax=Lasiosphaeria miniovina TaxID=1954250 RepID=A0AA39ZSW0_9PEZI|nr:uncharacterized protein B0T26DRAFT_680778 [Lasiosphaeria miniovina]KAK0703017.1 hypothetical protein B0T26DRAFT_680778 [Lasiosphaeria miniovina]